MESVAVLRSFHSLTGSISHAHCSLERPGATSWSSLSGSRVQEVAFGKLTSSIVKQNGILAACAKTTEMRVSSKSDDIGQNGSMEKHGLRSATFPNAFEALVSEVCDETSVAELKLKVGDFEMHMKRNISGANVPVQAAPPVPAEPAVPPSAPTTPPSSAPKPSAENVNPFASASSKSASIAALEAAGSTFKLVTSPTVGLFRKGRMVKGKRQPPICKQGDVIKEGQVIGYVDRFGSELPVTSDVDGEVLKLLFADGEAVGYGDPLIAVLPSFHGINIH